MEFQLGSGMEFIPRAECLAHLESQHVGRLGFLIGDQPVVLPVNYGMESGVIVFRTGDGAKLGAARGSKVAFEVDDLDADTCSGWSVVVHGVADDITDLDDWFAERLRAVAGPPCVPGVADHFVRITPSHISGRRLPADPRSLNVRRMVLPSWVPGGPPPTPERKVTSALDLESSPPDATAATLSAAVAETHSAVVFFFGDRAYKLKKAVNLGFLDFRTRDARLEACHREVTLNRRLAPDVYLGVADVNGPDGQPLDHLVVMRRMPDDRRMSSMATSGVPMDEHLERLASRLAEFHHQADRSSAIDEAATRDATAGRWESNAVEMEPFRGRLFDPSTLDAVMDRAHHFLAGRTALFEQRIADGRSCDGHGDLLADDIFCLDDGPRVLDCLEFDDHLRFGDALADAAFLAMDLRRLGRADLAIGFLDRYRLASGDSWPSSLAHHYIAYRAQVRAKVSAVRWSQGDVPSAAAARHLLDMCCEHLRAGEVRLVLVGGLPGTGKSTVARGVAEAVGASVFRSDDIRKELAMLDPLQPAPATLDRGLYQPSMTESTYTELLSRGRRALSLGETVVLDATWRDPRWRNAAASLASETSSDMVALRCVAPLEVTVDRVNQRIAKANDPSDATESVTRALSGHEPPWTTATTIDTAGETADAVAAALATIGAGTSR